MTMSLANPKINAGTTSVPNLINAIPRTNPARFSVSGTIPIPPWWSANPVVSIERHFQGIAPYNGTGGGPTIANGCISASSTTGYFAGFSQAEGKNPQVRSVVTPSSSYFHLAAIQMLGDLLPAPLESTDENDKGLVAFYNVGNLAAPSHLYTLTMPARKASAVGITTYTDSSGTEQCLMVVYEYDHKWMYVYQTAASNLPGSAAVWTLKTTYQGSAFNTGDNYQGFSLVTQTGSGGDTVYLVGFREDEEIWLWTVNTTSGSSFGQFTYVNKYTGWNGSDFRNGTGLQIASTTNLRIFGTDKDPSGSSTYPGGPANYSFNIYVYKSS